MDNAMKRMHNRRKEAGLCVRCGKNPSRPGAFGCESCTFAKNDKIRLKRVRQRQQALDHYGRICACPKCPERLNPVEKLLTIDHIDGGGNEHAREIGSFLYNWLENMGYPPGFRTLCFNCNTGRADHINGGICPHME